MRIHHLNCISTCPLGASLFERHARGLRGRLACHCLLIETPSGLVLVDTGFGLRDVADPGSRLSRFFLGLLSPDLREEMTAIRQIERLGFHAKDVRHIVLTHLDFDHAGGLDDFPDAWVHMLASEREWAEAQSSVLDRMRYRPQQWRDRSRWLVYPSRSGEKWFGFDRVRGLGDLDDDILLVPLLGHTFGHAGVAVRSERDGWLLMAGDAYFHHGEMDLEEPRCPLGLRAYQWLMEKDRAMRLDNQDRLRRLKRTRDGQVRIVSAHDVVEFERLAGRPLVEPVSAFDLPTGEPAVASVAS